MQLPGPDSLSLKNKIVLLRLDLDVPVKEGRVLEGSRIRVSLGTINLLFQKDVHRIVILGHRGRPGGRYIKELSLKPVWHYLQEILKKNFSKDQLRKTEVTFLENLRFNKEETADPASSEAWRFAKKLAAIGQIYINDAFGSSHREHASIVLLPKLLPHAAGLHLLEEVKQLERVLENPKKPVVFILGGGKLEKALLVNKLIKHAEWLLVGGVLPKKITSFCNEDGNMCVSAAHLTHDGEDITPDSAKAFEEIIKTAGTIVWNGPMGDIDSGFWDGTEKIANAVVHSNAFTVVGGGDTIHALDKLGLLSKIDYISTGGGAMLEFLAYGDLPGLQALRE